MKTFEQYLQLRESYVDVGRSTIGQASLTDKQETAISTLYQVVDKIFEAQPIQFITLLKGHYGNMSPEISEMLSKIESDPQVVKQATLRTKGSGFEDEEEIVPAGTDQMAGEESE